MLAIEWSAHARADLLAIIEPIASANPTAAQRFTLEIQTKTARLARYPRLQRAGRVDGTRERVVRPNYVLVYAELPGAIRVLRLVHTTRQWPLS